MAKQATSHSGSIKQKMLVIDPDAETVSLLENRLANDFELVAERRFEKAIQMAENEQPHVIVLAVDSAEGREVLTRLHEHPILAIVPLIVLGRETSEEAQRSALQGGACIYLSKPLKVVSLRDTIRETLQNLNVEIKSSDSSRVVQLAYSSAEKMRQMHARIQTEVTLGRRVIVMSPLVGRQFAQRFKDVQEWIDDGKVIYLEIKPLLPAKMEYMEDLTTILRDLERIIELGANDSLLVDEPEALLLPQNGQPNAARIHAFERSVARVFEGVYYFSRRSAAASAQQAMHSMAKALVGNL